MKGPLLKFAVAGAALFSLVLFFLLPRYTVTTSYVPSIISSSKSATAIPNIAHFVYILSNTSDTFDFAFSHYLSIFAASYYWNPTTIYFHTNADAASRASARDGTSGKWTQLIFNTPNLIIHSVEAPTHAGNGHELQGMEHRSDFVRVQAVHDVGGVYIDWDVHALRDLKPLRESGFSAVAGKQIEEQINSGTFLSRPESKMMRLWVQGMNEAYTGGWTTHSNAVLTQIGRKLVAEPGEMLVLERDAFAPWSWNGDDCARLFSPHQEEPSNLEGVRQGDLLPEVEAGTYDEWTTLEETSDFPRDWSNTYLLHAFDPYRFGNHIEGFDKITPRYVLERRSNFARAVYPVAKEMYDRGLVSIDEE